MDIARIDVGFCGFNLVGYCEMKRELINHIKFYKVLASDVDNPTIDTSKNIDVNRRIIQSDRIKRLQILDYSWKEKRKGTRNLSSYDIERLLKIDDIDEINFHLDTLRDLGLIRIEHYLTNSIYEGIEITGPGTTKLEDFFLQIDEEIRSSENTELQKQIHEIDQTDDVYAKHEKFIAIMSTIQEGFAFGNKILKGLGIS